jgi:hypothetical protein
MALSDIWNVTWRITLLAVVHAEDLSCLHLTQHSHKIVWVSYWHSYTCDTVLDGFAHGSAKVSELLFAPPGASLLRSRVEVSLLSRCRYYPADFHSRPRLLY